jgi:hypothetical protein
MITRRVMFFGVLGRIIVQAERPNEEVADFSI